jgi:hypothetical protein
MRAIISLAASLAFAVGALGCSNNSSTTTSPTTTSPTTVTIASTVPLRGSAVRTFSMTTAGTVKVTLTALGNGVAAAGLGLGVSATGAPCSLAQSVATGPGSAPQIVASADAGNYCVQVFDLGTMPSDTGFSITVEHP